MHFRKRFRTYVWLVQSLLNRYKKHIIVGFFLGCALVLLNMRLFPAAQAVLFPSTTVIGMIGYPESSKLPLPVQRLISAGFTRLTEQGIAEPFLAEKWEVAEDGKRYFFKLRPNQYWHDGSEFTAFDVNYNFQDVVIAPADRLTLKVELEEPFAPLPSLLSRPLFKPGLVGMGPYRIIRLELLGNSVKRITLRPNDDPATAADERIGKEMIDIKFYPTMQDALLAFELGEIDVLENMPSGEHFTQYPNVSISSKVQYDRFMAIFFNTQHELLKTKELRQALSYGAPVVEGADAISPISVTSWAFNANIKEYTYNRELALDLVERAGIATSSPTIELTTFPEYLGTAEKVAESWNDIGITTNVKVVQAFPEEFEALLGVQEVPPDPDQYALWHSTQATNSTRYNNPKIDKLLEEGRTKTDQTERLTIYRDFQKYLVEDAPAHFLIHPTVYTITRR